MHFVVRAPVGASTLIEALTHSAVDEFDGRIMYLEPLNISLTQISILVKNLNKKNYTQTCESLNKVSVHHIGLQFHKKNFIIRHLFVCRR